MKCSAKRVIAFVMVIILAVGIVPVADISSVKAAAKSVKSGGVVYEVLDAKKLTAKVTSSSKGIKKAVIKNTVKIGKKKYKVVSIGNKAFKNAKKLTNVTIGENVTKIGKYAFQNAKKLKTIKIKNGAVKSIGESAFSGIYKKAKFIVPYGTLKKMSKLIKKKKTGYKKTMKIVEADKPSDAEKDEKDAEDYSKYSYSIEPLSEKRSNYFYVKTDNPDPKSFIFVDDDIATSKEEVKISVADVIFADVKYEDEKNYRVKGGYIFYGVGSDGGTLKLKKRVQIDYYLYDYEETGVTVLCPELISGVQYLIDTYTEPSMSFFEKMDAVERGLSSICLYSGAYVLGNLKKSEETPYYGLSTSPHVDQTFYIQDPYSRTDSKSMLVSGLYPYILDSLGFPGEMAAVAKRLDPSAQCEADSDAHWLVDVTYNGETRAYGGAGNGGGQGIKEDMLNHQYTFDGSENDFSTKKSWDDIRKKICEYGNMKVPTEIPENEALTWKQVTDTVGKGSYVRLLLLTSVFGGSSIGYSFMYDKGNDSPGYMSDCWFDGRYFNRWEFFQKGAKFEDYPDVSIVFKDFEAKLPALEEGKQYFYGYGGASLSDYYDEETGIWKGYSVFYYDNETQTWKNDKLSMLRIGDADKSANYANEVDDETIADMFTLTLQEVQDMNIDGNTDSDPTQYYIYDMVSPPGSKE